MYRKLVSLLVLLSFFSSSLGAQVLPLNIQNNSQLAALKSQYKQQSKLDEYTNTVGGEQLLELTEQVAKKEKEKKEKKEDIGDDVFDALSQIEKEFNRQVLSATRLPSYIKITSNIEEKAVIIESSGKIISDIKDEAIQKEKINKADIVYQFGYDVFEKSKAQAPNFNPKDSPIGPDYVLGPGDLLLIQLWGKLDEVMELSISPEGSIYVPKVGNIFIAGERLDSARRIIKKALGRYYINFEISVTLKELRTIKVFVLGAVAKPGAYDLSSLSTVFSALYAAGGPTKLGSLRSIQLKRSNQANDVIDLYEYLLKGDKSQDPKLDANDTIFVPPIGDVAMISGMVKRPGIFEIKSKISFHQGLVDLAGGFTAYSYQKRIQLYRPDRKEDRLRLKDYFIPNKIVLRKVLKSNYFSDGDRLIVAAMSEEKQDIVTIKGHVYRPGDYGFHKGLTLDQLIKKAEGAKPQPYLKRVEVKRFLSDEQQRLISVDYQTTAGQKFVLKDRDEVKLYSMEEIFGASYVYIYGAIQKPGAYKLLDNMTISDLIFMAGLKEQADLNTMELYQKDADGSDKLLAFDFSKILDDGKSSDDISLKGNEHVFVRYKENSRTYRRIELSGEVKYPGVYYALNGEPLSSVIERAGGFSDNAFLAGTVFKRRSVKERERAGQKAILDEERKRLIYDQARLATLAAHQGEGLYKDAISFLEEQMLDSVGRVVVDLSDYSRFINSQDDLIVEDGDSLFVPEVPSTVQLVGGVKYSTAIAFVSDKGAQYYIDLVGGYSEFADHGVVYVFKANGAILKNPKRIEQGDTIYVPETIRVHVDWLQIITSTFQTVFNLVATLKIVSTGF